MHPDAIGNYRALQAFWWARNLDLLRFILFCTFTAGTLLRRCRIRRRTTDHAEEEDFSWMKLAQGATSASTIHSPTRGGPSTRSNAPISSAMPKRFIRHSLAQLVG